MQFCLRFPKISFVLTYDNWKCQKSRFKNVMPSSIPLFAIAQQKSSWLEIVYTCWYIALYYMFRFFDVFKKVLYAFIFEKKIIIGFKYQNFGNPKQSFCGAFRFASFDVFHLRFTSNQWRRWGQVLSEAQRAG